MLSVKTINMIFWVFFALVFCLFLSTFARADNWKWHDDRSYIPPGDEKIFTADKEAHFLGGIVWQKVGTDLLQELDIEYRWSMIGAFATGLCAAVAKEWSYDAFRDGFSFGDIFMQMAGQGISGVLWTRPKEKDESETTIELCPRENGICLVVRF